MYSSSTAAGRQGALVEATDLLYGASVEALGVRTQEAFPVLHGFGCIIAWQPFTHRRLHFTCL